MAENKHSAKMWAGVTSGITSSLADDFNSSIGFDSRMYKQDIGGSIAHAAMLASSGIITVEEAVAITAGLEGILRDLESGALEIDPGCEDIHMFVEAELTSRIGAAGKKLHTARSRNDQVALDIRLYLRERIGELISLAAELASAVTDKAEQYKGTVMPGYTHLQRAQPITFGHQLMAYVFMLLRDISRLRDCRERMNVSPIGSCALAGTTYPTNRRYEAELLGFSSVCQNSIDGVSDRDFSLELLSDISIMMMHLSRFSEEIILWSSWEFGFVHLSDAFTTGSSIMPQKKNPDMAELVRGKTGRVYGDMISLFTTLKGLPLAYNKDMQEDKECVFDAVDTAVMCLKVFSGMIEGMQANPERMKKAAQTGFINATDLADYLVGRGLPFREAYKKSGELVALCTRLGTVLDELPLEEYKKASGLFESDVYDAIDLDACVARRTSEGGTAPEQVAAQIASAREQISKLRA